MKIMVSACLTGMPVTNTGQRIFPGLTTGNAPARKREKRENRLVSLMRQGKSLKGLQTRFFYGMISVDSYTHFEVI